MCVHAVFPYMFTLVVVGSLVSFLGNTSHAGSTKSFFFTEASDQMTHSATAVFHIDRNVDRSSDLLVLDLTNDSKGLTHSATDVLLGLFFNINGSLTPASAELNGSIVVSDSSQTIHPGDGWEVRSGISHEGYNAGVAAAGYGIFGPDGNLNPDGQPVKLDGSDYGLVGRSFSQSVANASVKLPLFNNGLRFTFKVSEG